MRFFFDNNLSQRLSRAIGELCAVDVVEVVHLKDRFPSNISDVEWIETLGREGDWTVVSQDRLTKNPLEKEALRLSGLTAFILVKGWNSHKHWDKAAQLVRWWPRIMEVNALVAAGAVFEVPWRVTGKGRFKPIKL